MLSRTALLALGFRPFFPVVMPQGYKIWLYTSGLLWILAFLLFLWVHAPMLIALRADGKPG
jgi:uncharacterized protein involved in response to NO